MKKSDEKKLTKLLEHLKDTEIFDAFIERMGGISGLENLVTCHKEFKDVDDFNIGSYLNQFRDTSIITTNLINEMEDDKYEYLFTWIDEIRFEELDSLNNRATIAQLVGLKRWATVPEILEAIKSHIS